jgi:hypothetical protein
MLSIAASEDDGVCLASAALPVPPSLPHERTRMPGYTLTHTHTFMRTRATHAYSCVRSGALTLAHMHAMDMCVYEKIRPRVCSRTPRLRECTRALARARMQAAAIVCRHIHSLVHRHRTQWTLRMAASGSPDRLLWRKASAALRVYIMSIMLHAGARADTAAARGPQTAGRRAGTGTGDTVGSHSACCMHAGYVLGVPRVARSVLKPKPASHGRIT